MLEWAKDNLYVRTSDEWSYDTLEADPLVHLLIGACASEAKEVYETIHESDDRILNRLLHYLLPESFHLPLPAVAIAKANTRISSCLIPNTQSLVFRDVEKERTFTPLFDTKLINGQIRFIGTDTEIIEKKDTPHYYVKNKTQTVSSLLLGIETPEKIKSLENVAFYIDWKGEELEKRQLLQALSKSKWIWNEQVLKRQNGFLDASTTAWQDQFSPEQQLAKSINAQYQRQFHLITDKESPPEIKVSVLKVFQAWLNKHSGNVDQNQNTTEQWADTKGNFIWLKIQLPYDIALTDIEKNLTIALNHFIVVNRSLQTKDDNDTYFSRSLGMEALEIKPKKGLFHSIKNVHNQIKNKSIPAKSLTKLIGDKKQTAYSFRLGGVGRLDSYNAWQRFSYMLSVFRKEHKLKEVYERLGDKLSLEELHEAIGSQISTKEAQQANTQIKQMPCYLFVQPGENRSQLRIKVDYWETDGEAANGLRPDSKLICEPALAGLDMSSIQLITSPRGGKDAYSATEKTQALQDTLFRRGRIVSAHDVKSLCFQKIGKSLKEVTLRTYFETNRNLTNGGVQRAIEVSLKVVDAADTYIHQLGQEIELTLQENSVGTMPYRVVITQA